MSRKPDITLTKALAAVMARRSAKSVFRLLRTILTEKELEHVEKRLRIARLLDEGKSYTQIQNELKVSAATVALVSDQLKDEDFRSLADAINREQSRFRWFQRL